MGDPVINGRSRPAALVTAYIGLRKNSRVAASMRRRSDGLSALSAGCNRGLRRSTPISRRGPQFGAKATPMVPSDADSPAWVSIPGGLSIQVTACGGMEVVSQSRDLLPQLQPFQPVRRNGNLAE